MNCAIGRKVEKSCRLKLILLHKWRIRCKVKTTYSAERPNGSHKSIKLPPLRVTWVMHSNPSTPLIFQKLYPLCHCKYSYLYLKTIYTIQELNIEGVGSEGYWDDDEWMWATKGTSDAYREQVYNTNVKIITLLHCRVLCCAKQRRDTHAVNIQVAFDRKWFSNIVYCSVGPFMMNIANSVDDMYGYFKHLKNS
jgi:hypothetical protein